MLRFAGASVACALHNRSRRAARTQYDLAKRQDSFRWASDLAEVAGVHCRRARSSITI